MTAPLSQCICPPSFSIPDDLAVDFDRCTARCSPRRERALQREDPKFAARQSIDRVRWRRMVAAVTIVLLGLLLLVVGLITTQATLVVGVIVSVTGFFAMVGGVALVIRRRH